MSIITTANGAEQLLDALGDQIHLKLYAAVDQGPGRHEADLRALRPTADELVAAARWTRTHDPSEGYLAVLRQVLESLGVHGADLGS